MLFRRLIFSAVMVGVLSGLLLSLSQTMGVTPIILAAEQYEMVEADHHAQLIMPAISQQDADHHHAEIAGAGHHHGDAWAPEDGVERTLYTVLANILTAIGFASILLVMLSQLKQKNLIQLQVKQGIQWGLAGFATFFMLPSLGLPPEIPGTIASALENRQSWWILAIVCSAFGLFVLAFAPLKSKVLGLLILAAPFIIGAPQVSGPLFAHPDPNVVMKLTELHQEFVFASSLSNLVFWLALAMLSVKFLSLWVFPETTKSSSELNAAG